MRLYIFDDSKMLENSIGDVLARLKRIFKNGRFMHGLSRPAVAWLDVKAGEVASSILAFFENLSGDES